MTRPASSFQQPASSNQQPASRITAALVWALVGAIVLVSLIRVLVDLDNQAALENPVTGAWNLLAPVFAIAGGLIVASRARNIIGWLLMLPASATVVVFSLLALLPPVYGVPTNPPILLYVAVWFLRVGWLLIIFPILFIALLFPTSRLPSPRWRWVAGSGLGLWIFLWVAFIFVREYRPPAEFGLDWVLDNPIGLLALTDFDAIIPRWLPALGAFTILCALSLVVRWRRAGRVERDQIKWLLFAAAILVLIYVPVLLFWSSVGGLGLIFNVVLPLSFLPFPVAITIAILRHRLFDIDIIIRRTLQYSIVSAVLALIYFGSVVLLQRLTGLSSQEQSPLVIVLSTLLIAALFNPLRRRVQAFIDRRFYRQQYDAQQVLADFAATARDDVSLPALTAELTRVVEETMQPAGLSLWLREQAE